MEQAVNGSGGELHREAIVDTKKVWTCAECNTINNPNAFDLDESPDQCVECGAVRPHIEDDEAQLLADEHTALALGETPFDDENATGSEEGIAPRDQELPLDFGPFNSDSALKAIFEKSAEVRDLQADYERKKDAAKDAKSELDIAAKALVNIIESLKNRRTQALNPSQPYLREVSEIPGQPVCPWEREHPGQTCPICVQAKADLINVDVNSEVHPEHEGHAAIAEAARVKNVLEPLASDLADFNLFAEVTDLQGLSTEDLEALKAYVDEPTPMPPQLLARCCVAEANGSLVQVCKNCGRTLATETENTTRELDWFPVGSLVGFDCASYVERSAEEHAEEFFDNRAKPAPRAEPARTIKARGSRKTAKKQPEQERANQAEAARKAAAKPAKKAKRGKAASK